MGVLGCTEVSMGVQGCIHGYISIQYINVWVYAGVHIDNRIGVFQISQFTPRLCNC